MDVDAEYRLETPENIEVSFDLAGPGSRFCAMIIDTLLMSLLIVVVFIGACIADASWLREFDQSEAEFSPWALAIAILLAVLVMFGYFLGFEILMRGQTPGKRSLKLRVLRDDGTPATALDLCVRNLLRIVDCLPGFYVVGGVVSLFSRTHKRLGDLAAGTIVVKEAELDYRAQADRRPAAQTQAEVALGNPALTADEQRILRGFLQRRAELTPDARRALAERLANSLWAKHGGTGADPETYLERLALGQQYEP